MKDKFIVMNVAIVALGILAVAATLVFGFAPNRAADAEFKTACLNKGGVVVNYQCYFTEKGAP